MSFNVRMNYLTFNEVFVFLSIIHKENDFNQKCNMKMKSNLSFSVYKFIIYISLILVPVLMSGQTAFTATYTFGSNGNVASFDYNGTTIDGVTMNPLLKMGVTTSSSSGNFRADDWPTGGFDASKHIELSMQAVAGYEFTVTSITFGIGRSASGTRNTEWRGNHDNFASTLNNYTTLNIGLTNNSGVLNNPDTNLSWNGNVLDVSSQYSEITSAVFRLYLYNSEAIGGTAGLQGPITIVGTYRLSAQSCTPPAIPSGTISGTTPSCNSTMLNFSGTAPTDVTYFWQTSPTGDLETNNASSSFNATSSGTYYVRAKSNTEECWSDATTGYAVTINTSPTIETQPTNQSVLISGQAVFSVSSFNATSFQWQVNTGSGWNNVTSGSGGNTSNYSTPLTTTAMNGQQYRVIVSNFCGDITSNAVTLIVIEGLCFDEQAINEGIFTRVGTTILATSNTSLRLASASNSGSISTAPLSGISGNVTFRAEARGWSATENTFTVNLGGVEAIGTVTNTFASNDTSTSFEWVEVVLNGVPTSPVLNISCSTSKRVTFRSIELICAPSTQEPHISVAQGSNNIPTVIGNYNFGNQLINSSGAVVSFLISNDGNADLTLGIIALSGANANQFSINTTSTSTTVSESGSTEFTISFLPTSLGSKSATVTIPNNAGADFTFTISGNGSNSANSIILENNAYSYTSNILYTSFQSASISNTSSGTNGSLGVFQFSVQDGGETSDEDELPTTLNSIDFIYTGQSNTIRAAALFQGNGKLADGTVTANGISFSGLNIQAPDNGNSPNITLRVTFNSTVLDNQQLQFTVNNAIAHVSGSVFATLNAGGATSSITADRNRIEVTADRLAFTTQPVNQTVGINLATFTVSAVDVFNNLDLDYSNPNQMQLSSSGVDLSSSSPYIFNNGQINVADVSFASAPQNNITITATTSGLAFSNTMTSNNFNITDIIIEANSYRTVSSGTWPNSGTANWERFVSGSWQSSTAPGANSIHVLIIRHNITTNAAFAATEGTKMIVANGGTLNGGHNCTFSNLTIEDGGVINITSPAVTMQTNTGLFTVESGGKVIINSATLNNADGIWRGIENFKEGSVLEIQNWDWDSSSGQERLIDSTNAISTNADGYFFGNIYFNANPDTKAFTFIGQSGNHKLCQNDLIIKNMSTTRNVILTNVNANIEIGGSVIAQQNRFSFGSVGSSQPTHLVKENIIGQGGTIDLNQQSAVSATIFVNVEGNLNIPVGSSLISTDDGCKIVFSGNASQPQTISVAGNLGARVDFEVANGAEVQLINQDFDLTNASNDFDVLNGGTIHFNYFNVLGLGKFTQASGGILKITSSDGVNVSGNNTGNIQNTGTRTYSQTGQFQFVGNISPQATGNAMTLGTTAKRIVIEKDNPTDVVNLTQTTGTSNQLYIKKGIFNESMTSFVTGGGSLQMDLGGTYRMYVLNTSLPQVSGSYILNEGSSVELLGSGNQELRGGRAYYDLVFGNGGVKTISSAINTISGGVLIDNNTVLDVQSSTFGGTNTDLFMAANSRFINGGSSIRPNIGGDYLLDETSTIEFTGISATTIRTTDKTYANVEISGTNVTLSTPSTSMDFMPNTTFKVKTGGVFKVKNSNGFSGSNNTAIRNTNNPLIILEPNSKIAYVDTNNQIITSEAEYAKLDLMGEGLKTFNGDVVVNEDLVVAENAEVLLPTNQTLTVLGKIEKNNLEDFTIENNAYLMQSSLQTNNQNVGELKIQRRTSLIRRGDITIWSSPVANQNLLSFSPHTLTNRFYVHNETTNQFSSIAPGSNSFQTGIGYGIRARNTLLSSDPMEEWQGTFAGVPNNGNYGVSITKNHPTANYNMIGNPYPSALSLFDLYQENAAIISNNFYLYEHTLPSNIPSGNPAYTNYGVLTVGTPSIYAPATQSDESNPSEINPYDPIVQAGQGFFVRAIQAGTLNFENNMRRAENSRFYRMQEVQSENSLDMFRIKLTLPNQFSNQAVIGFFESTSNEVDEIDTKGFGGSPLYSILGTDNFIIQARQAPLEMNTVIPLGFHASEQGNYKFSLAEALGVFESNVTVFLHDAMLQQYHNLSLSPYEFISNQGTHDQRFTVLFAPLLNAIQPNFNQVSWQVVPKQQGLSIQIFGNELIQNIEIYDVIGRIVSSSNHINQPQFYLPWIAANQTWIVKMTTTSGVSLTSKVIF